MWSVRFPLDYANLCARFYFTKASGSPEREEGRRMNKTDFVDRYMDSMGGEGSLRQAEMRYEERFGDRDRASARRLHERSGFGFEVPGDDFDPLTNRAALPPPPVVKVARVALTGFPCARCDSDPCECGRYVPQTRVATDYRRESAGYACRTCDSLPCECGRRFR